MKKETIKLNNEIAIIHWQDSWNFGLDQYKEKDWKNKVGVGQCVSVGFVVAEDKEQISIALDYFYPQKLDEGSFRVVNTFPKCNIQKIIRIKIPSEIYKEINKYCLKDKEKPKEGIKKRNRTKLVKV